MGKFEELPVRRQKKASNGGQHKTVKVRSMEIDDLAEVG